MLIDGTVVMVIGMGTVFSFLGIMVALMHLMAIVMKHFPGQTPIQVTPTRPSVSADSRQAEEIAVVIAAARAYAEGKQQ